MICYSAAVLKSGLILRNDGSLKECVMVIKSFSTISVTLCVALMVGLKTKDATWGLTAGVAIIVIANWINAAAMILRRDIAELKTHLGEKR